jgi:transposase
VEDVTSLKAIISELHQIIVSLQKELSIVREELNLVKEELSQYKHPKNSKNSSIPPSKDENRPLPNQSLRSCSSKKAGGQSGHKGHTLEMVSTPNQIHELKNDFCMQCGHTLVNSTFSLVEKRQVIDIPPIVRVVTEYQSYSTVCRCGHCNKASFPVGVEAPVQYGSRVQSMVAYLSTRQYISMNRIKEYMGDVFQIHLSEGSIQNMLKKMAHRAEPFYNCIKEAIENALELGGDETSCRINGKKGWIWVLQNLKYTFLHCSDNRGFTTLNQLFSNGLPHAILIHDAYPAWFKIAAKAHQLCLAHIQRDLNYFAECYQNCDWVERLKQLFYQATQEKENPQANSRGYKQKLLQLLEAPPDGNFTLLKPFVKRLKKYQDAIFTFLDYKAVPPDNNGSERALRNVKVKTKVSGQFKSIENAQTFAVIRSVIDTLIKNNQPVLPSLNIIANFSPE